MGGRHSSVVDFLYRVSMWIVDVALLVIVTIIPIGMFVRYVLNSILSWPEPVTILRMVTFTSIGVAVSYRAGSHTAVSTVIDCLGDASHCYCSVITNVMLVAMSLLILWYGTNLCFELWG